MNIKQNAFFLFVGLAIFSVHGAEPADVRLRGYEGQRVAEWEAARPEVLAWFTTNFYGKAPVGRPADETFGEHSVSFAGGRLTIDLDVTLPVSASPTSPVPVFVLGDHYMLKHGCPYPHVPTNAITARGYAFVYYNFNHVAPDRLVPETNRFEGVFREYGGYDKRDGWGKVSAWAWGFSRVMDWIETRPELDAKRVAVVGHSRCGKTALWAAAQDRRIALAIANGSGTGGAHLNSVVTPGCELVDAFIQAKSWNFFAPIFLELKGHERELPHDADDLLRLIAPRAVFVSSALDDDGAGPRGAFEATRRASELWRAYGKKGLSLTGYPPAGTIDLSGTVGYSLSPGGHLMSTANWMTFLDFADRVLCVPMDRFACRCD